MIPRATAASLLLLLLSATCLADVRLPGVFSDHMVLQRDAPVAVWGWADAGERVTVGFREASITTETDADGRWRVELPAQTSGGPDRITVRGKNTLVVEDVLVGEVWICSGQSNMEWPVSASANAQAEIAAGDDPLIRHFKVPHLIAGAPVDDVAGTWQVCSPATVGRFTACGYFMARELRDRLDVPVGLVNASWGGTRIEPWIPQAGLDSAAALAEIAERARQSESQKPKNHQQPTVLFNGMIHPVVGYGMRGVIWYQGESNLGETRSYTEKMRALIASWREAWGGGEFPFH